VKRTAFDATASLRYRMPTARDDGGFNLVAANRTVRGASMRPA
jgi:hypothetical protein